MLSCKAQLAKLQVESVDIKRLPDGSSRGFAFVKFADKETGTRFAAKLYPCYCAKKSSKSW